MATKQITDLGSTTTFDDGDLLLVRKTSEGIDKKIAQADFIKSFGNPAINGFIATSEDNNKLTLTASNNVLVDTYYNGMTANFISTINSNGIVQIKIGELAYKDFIQYGTTQSVILTVNKYLEAIYIGDSVTGKWYQTNTITPTVYTNEYLATGVVAPGEQSTTYTLTSAVGTTKTSYYNGMSLLFTSNIASKGAVLLNVDGLGLKALTDQVGDNISFNLGVNETVMAIYNGTNFIKNIFSTVDKPLPPVNPDLPIPPEQQETINVGPNEQIKLISEAINQLVQSYGEDGGNRFVTIQLSQNFTLNEELKIVSRTPWITIQSHNNGNTLSKAIQIFAGAISFKGTFNINASRFLTIDTFYSGYAIVKNSTINSIYTGGVKYAVEFLAKDNPDQLMPATIFENVNISNFDTILYSTYAVSSNNGNRSNFQFTTGTCDMTQNNSSYIIDSYGKVSLTDINFGNVNRSGLNTVPLLSMSGLFNFVNVSLTSATNIILGAYNVTGSRSGSLKNCNMRNTSTNAIPAVVTRIPIAFDGGDFRHPNSSNNPDIVIESYPTAKCTKTNNTLANFDVKTPDGRLTEI